MVDVKNTGKTAESGGIHNVGDAKAADAKAAKEAEAAPKDFSEAQAIYEAKEKEAAEAAAKVKQEEPAEPTPSARAQKEMAAGAAALGGTAKK